MTPMAMAEAALLKERLAGGVEFIAPKRDECCLVCCLLLERDGRCREHGPKHMQRAYLRAQQITEAE